MCNCVAGCLLMALETVCTLVVDLACDPTRTADVAAVIMDEGIYM